MTELVRMFTEFTANYIQNKKGKAKPYQVKQVLLAIENVEVHHGI